MTNGEIFIPERDSLDRYCEWSSLPEGSIFFKGDFIYCDDFPLDKNQKAFLLDHYHWEGYALLVGPEEISISDLGYKDGGMLRRPFAFWSEVEGIEQLLWANVFFKGEDFKMIKGEPSFLEDLVWKPECVFRGYRDEVPGRALIRKQEGEKLFGRSYSVQETNDLFSGHYSEEI